MTRWLTAAAIAACLAVGAVRSDERPVLEPEFGRAVFLNPREPPGYRTLTPEERERADLGHAIFNTQFVAAGLPRAAHRDGLGPLFNASACDACHNEGAHGRGPTGDGQLPSSLVIELTAPDSTIAHPRGDPRYGRTFNVAALDGFDAEGKAAVRYTERSGHYGDGEQWSLRAPRYTITDLHFGSLATETVVQPRLAPALFGLGLLALVPSAEPGRFGWQNTARSLGDQTAQALSRDMGLTSPSIGHDDCTAFEEACRDAANGGAPEIDSEFFGALVAFQETLAVPERTTAGKPLSHVIFVRMGCSTCHTATRKILVGKLGTQLIHPYSDLKRHAMGRDLSDRTVGRRVVNSTFRTAPLWGLGYRLATEPFPTFLHDGRARSLSEAVLWHGGEAAPARDRFLEASSSDRNALIEWLSGL